ncbi:MAG TPA: hypothetical protein V6D47_22160, partial [Oscillatoriaceae cyanobacterium]
LASIGISNYLDSLDTAKNSEVVGNENIVRIALENYASDHDDAMPSGLCTDATFSNVGYLPNNQMPLAPWCKRPQVTDDIMQMQASWQTFITAEKNHTDAVHTDQVGTIADPPVNDLNFGFIRYGRGTDAHPNDATCPNTNKVYYMCGEGKRGNRHIVVGLYTNNLQ